MPRKKPPARELPAIPPELLDQLVSEPIGAGEAPEMAMAFKKALC
jgi:hypothetical protein